jgi:hypothetical protein
MADYLPLAPPTLARALCLWLTTLGLGTLFIGLFLVLAGSPDLWIALFALAIAGGASLPTLLVLPVSIRWALAGATAQVRGWRLFGFVMLLFGLALLVCRLYFHDEDLMSLVFWFSAPYFVAALLAAYFLYQDWLNPPLAVD